VTYLPYLRHVLTTGEFNIESRSVRFYKEPHWTFSSDTTFSAQSNTLVIIILTGDFKHYVKIEHCVRMETVLSGLIFS